MKLVVLDGYTLNPGDNPWTALEAQGELVVHDRTPPELVIERSRDADVLLTNKTVIDKAVLAEAKALRGITVLATGYNVVDLAAARERGIPVCNVPAYSTESVAQHTFALLLELASQVSCHDRSVHAGDWVQSEDFMYTKAPLAELSGRVFGIVGMGRIGRRVAEIGRAFGMTVVALASSRGTPDDGSCERLERARFFAEADILSLHCPLTEQTAGIINSDTLRRMKPSALLLNTSRGGLVVEQDLADALNRGHIAGAAVDVLSTEPPKPDNPLLSAKNCVITPHVAWATLAARRRLMAITAENVRAILAGAPINVVN
jgi:glycerate dehydrogenase